MPERSGMFRSLKNGNQPGLGAAKGKEERMHAPCRFLKASTGLTIQAVIRLRTLDRSWVGVEPSGRPFFELSLKIFCITNWREVVEPEKRVGFDEDGSWRANIGRARREPERHALLG